VALEAIARLEKLIDQLLAERVELLERNQGLEADSERLIRDRSRVSAELDKLLGKLKHLEGKAQ
jgi:hypothetical protein